MHFTREPTVETIITPKEGFKLVIRNSKGGGQEDLFVDAVEVISFGQSCFFRSLERPKSFVVPAADYEILEVRETRVALKTTGIEHGVKIPLKAASEEPAQETATVEPKRRERKRPRRRRIRGADEPAVSTEEVVERAPLIPPPTTLISETIARYKEPQPSVATPPQEEQPSEAVEKEEAAPVKEVAPVKEEKIVPPEIVKKEPVVEEKAPEEAPSE